MLHTLLHIFTVIQICTDMNNVYACIHLMLTYFDLYNSLSSSLSPSDESDTSGIGMLLHAPTSALQLHNSVHSRLCLLHVYVLREHPLVEHVHLMSSTTASGATCFSDKIGLSRPSS